jgi:hypothetical protein
MRLRRAPWYIRHMDQINSFAKGVVKGTKYTLTTMLIISLLYKAPASLDKYFYVGFTVIFLNVLWHCMGILENNNLISPKIGPSNEHID